MVKKATGGALEKGKLRTAAEMKRRIGRAQRLARKYVKPGVSLVDELLEERRAEALRENSDSGK